MSGYEKPQDSYVYGYTSTRPADQSYAGPAQPTFDPQFPTTQVDESHAPVPAHPMPYLGQSFEPRDTSYQSTPTSLIDARSRTSPEVTSNGPYTGRSGEIFRLSIRSKIDYTARSYSFTVLFGNTATPATILKNFYRDPFHHYTIQTYIPPIPTPDQVHTQPSSMPLLLDVQDENGQSISMKSLQSFTYLESPPYPRYATPLEVQKKRKYAEDMPEYSQHPAKRSASTPLHPRSHGVFPPASGAGTYNFDSGGLYAMPTVYDPASNPPQPFVSPVLQRSSQYGGSPPMQTSIKDRSPSLGSFSSYALMARSGPVSAISVAPQATRSHGERVSASSPNPPLIRTSILQPQASSSFRAPGFNPYTIYPSAKAKLEVQGDLLTMADFQGWTAEEKKVKRRLVEFHRRQEDSIIHASFKPVTVEERTQGANCVSCIYWEERGECFVTSVDTIQLLEGLVGVRFTVEEKNRIRRNLEGFKPLTVSKQKEDSESFFRLIMGFPNPKPRNIEKDVKVFPWSILSNALRKIIGKYSASYASTSAILTPSTTAGFVTSVGDSGIEHLPTASPRSTTSSAASHSYSARMTNAALSSNNPGRPTIEANAGTFERMRQTSQTMPTIGPWVGQYSSVAGPTHYAVEQTAHSGRSSWDMNAFGGQQHLANTASQPLHYYAGSSASEHVPPTEYPTHSQAHH